MATNHAEQKCISTSFQHFKGPNVTINGSANTFLRVETMQSVNLADLPGETHHEHYISLGIAPTDATDYATSMWAAAPIGSECKHLAVTVVSGVPTVSGATKYLKVDNTGTPATDWKALALVP